MFDKKVHPGLAVLVEEEGHQHGRVAHHDHREQNPEHGELFSLREEREGEMVSGRRTELDQQLGPCYSMSMLLLSQIMDMEHVVNLQVNVELCYARIFGGGRQTERFFGSRFYHLIINPIYKHIHIHPPRYCGVAWRWAEPAAVNQTESY